MTQQDNPASFFSDALLNWFDVYGRKDLPWQTKKTPYRVWVSEIMLQQTQVTTVVPYYEKFMARFPTLESLAEAAQDEVLAHWSGLGYYARGRNLHKTAVICAEKHNHNLPDTLDKLVALPGIGRSTAGAILSIAHQVRAPILDGNVKRVLTRHFGVYGWPGNKQVEQKLWQLAEEHTPFQRFGDYTQAVMDLGATVCTRTKPNCPGCPHQASCYAFRHNTTSELPERKLAKPRPKKSRYFFVIKRANTILLEKQPEQGIWGGLWSLPSAEIEDKTGKEENLSLLASRTKIAVGATTIRHHQLQPFKHIFSHFELEIHPVLIFTDSEMKEPSPSYSFKLPANPAESAAADEKEKWITRQETADIGLPAPIKKILKQAFAAEEQLELW